MRKWCEWFGSVVAFLACASAHGALVPVSRNSEVRVSAAVGAQTDSDARQTTGFGTFDEAISADVMIPGLGTASASAEQRSFSNSATFSVSGAAATTETGTGGSVSSSGFTYRFSVTGSDELVRFDGAIARTESGVANASLRNLADPPGIFLLQRHLSEFPPFPGEPGPTWNEQFMLLSGHTYEVGFAASSQANTGMTSFSGEFTIVPTVPGDFNFNGSVDAADYVVWRKTDGSAPDYNLWRSHFGQTAGSGAALTSSGSMSAVPEPASLALAASALLLLLRRR